MTYCKQWLEEHPFLWTEEYLKEHAKTEDDALQLALDKWTWLVRALNDYTLEVVENTLGRAIIGMRTCACCIYVGSDCANCPECSLHKQSSDSSFGCCNGLYNQFAYPDGGEKTYANAMAVRDYIQGVIEERQRKPKGLSFKEAMEQRGRCFRGDQQSDGCIPYIIPINKDHFLGCTYHWSNRRPWEHLSYWSLLYTNAPLGYTDSRYEAIGDVRLLT